MQLTAVSSLLNTSSAQLETPTLEPQIAPHDTPQKAENKDFIQPDVLVLTGRLVGHVGGSGFAAYKAAPQMAARLKEMGQLFKTEQPANPQHLLSSMGQIALTGLQGAGLSALVSAGSSIIANGLGVVKDKIDSPVAVQNVISDTLTGAIGGLGAVTLGGTGHLALSAMGLAGLPLTIATVTLGAAGGTLAGHLAHKTRQAQPETQTTDLN
jgi:hypothetical protein